MTNFFLLIATVVIAIYAYKSHELAKQIKKESDAEKIKYTKLMTALITSNVIHCFQRGQTPESNLSHFNDNYPIIKEKLNVL